MNIVRRLVDDPFRSIYALLSFVCVWVFSLKRGWRAGKHLKLVGVPLVDIRNGGEILIGDRVTLNSRNRGYHINMYSRVKLFADRTGAVIEIGDDTRIHGSCFHAYQRISVGKRCLIAANCQIIDCNGHDTSMENPAARVHTFGTARPVVIEDDVWVGMNSIVLPGTHIGAGSIVAAGSVVSSNVPSMSIVAGNPAKVIKSVKK